MILSDTFSPLVVTALARVEYQDDRDNEDDQTSNADQSPLPNQQGGIGVPRVDTDWQIAISDVRESSNIVSDINGRCLLHRRFGVVVSEDAVEVLEEHAAKNDGACTYQRSVEVDNHELARADSSDDNILSKSGKRHADVVR